LQLPALFGVRSLPTVLAAARGPADRRLRRRAAESAIRALLAPHLEGLPRPRTRSSRHQPS
jgi:hypothetical protein